ncbi:hypothetical protein D3C72_2447980 [compost metagenome]
MLDEGCSVPATVFVKIGTGMQAVFIPVATQQKVVALIKAEVVLPVDGVAVGIELATTRL